jgi:hypothetical protein
MTPSRIGRCVRGLPSAVFLSLLSPALVLAQPTPGPTPPAPAPPAPAPSNPAAPAPTTAVPASAPPAAAETAVAAPAEPPPPAPIEPAAPPAAPEAAPADVEAGAAEAEALIEQLGSESGQEEYAVDIYGFIDFTYSHNLGDQSPVAPFNSFAVGNFNVYLASQLGDGFRSLAEVRFTYLPHGSAGSTATDFDGERTDTTVGDYTDLDRPIRWGGVVIERAWLEYEAHPLFIVRGGHWLSPYGIWNVDHGSPVIVGTRRPYIVGEGLIPTSQTGLEIYGTHGFDELLLGYHLTLSNGRGPVDKYQDLNANKAVGGRLYARLDSSFGTVTLGLSGYRGDYTDSVSSFVFDPDGGASLSTTRLEDYDELSYAADLKWEYSGFWLQSEAIANEVAYEEGVRPALQALPGADSGLVADYRRWGWYGLVGYRFDFLGIMPFFGTEYYEPSGGSFIPSNHALFTGLNVRPTARVVLKVQHTYAWFPGADLDFGAYNFLATQAAWSF